MSFKFDNDFFKFNTGDFVTQTLIDSLRADILNNQTFVLKRPPLDFYFDGNASVNMGDCLDSTQPCGSISTFLADTLSKFFKTEKIGDATTIYGQNQIINIRGKISSGITQLVIPEIVLYNTDIRFLDDTEGTTIGTSITAPTTPTFKITSATDITMYNSAVSLYGNLLVDIPSENNVTVFTAENSVLNFLQSDTKATYIKISGASLTESTIIKGLGSYVIGGNIITQYDAVNLTSPVFSDRSIVSLDNFYYYDNGSGKIAGTDETQTIQTTLQKSPPCLRADTLAPTNGIKLNQLYKIDTSGNVASEIYSPCEE